MQCCEKYHASIGQCCNSTRRYIPQWELWCIRLCLYSVTFICVSIYRVSGFVVDPHISAVTAGAIDKTERENPWELLLRLNPVMDTFHALSPQRIMHDVPWCFYIYREADSTSSRQWVPCYYGPFLHLRLCLSTVAGRVQLGILHKRSLDTSISTVIEISQTFVSKIELTIRLNWFR